MKKCYEFLYCEQMDCVRRDIEDKQCWEIEGTSCYDHSDIFTQYRALLADKIDACSKCNYYLIHNTAAEAVKA